jgi:hypothetical protein
VKICFEADCNSSTMLQEFCVATSAGFSMPEKCCHIEVLNFPPTNPARHWENEFTGGAWHPLEKRDGIRVCSKSRAPRRNVAARRGRSDFRNRSGLAAVGQRLRAHLVGDGFVGPDLDPAHEHGPFDPRSHLYHCAFVED